MSEVFKQLKNTIKELIDLNYIRRDKIRFSNGGFKHIIYHIYIWQIYCKWAENRVFTREYFSRKSWTTGGKSARNKEEISKKTDTHEDIDKPFLRRKPLINELIRLKYIKVDDEQLFFTIVCLVSWLIM